MSAATQSPSVPRKPLRASHLMKRVISYALLALVFFLLGFVPVWVKSQETASSLGATQQQLSLARLQNSLASAAIDAQRGQYAPALQSASSFFTALRAETDSGSAAALSLAQRAAVQPLLAQRDEIITLLARSDPAAGPRLSDLYAAYGQIVNN